MPKILINEKDRTSPGTPDRYANYAVLIAGLEVKLPSTETDRSDAEKKMATQRAELVDSNGAYEFTSQEVFSKVIGLVPPEQEVTINKETKKLYHYGNQMAYELLGLGYTVIYKPFHIDSIDNLSTDSFWEPFKDKASYDFRFISHGLLSSSTMTGVGEASIERLYEVQTAAASLKKILEDAHVGLELSDPVTIDEIIENEKDIFDGLKDSDALYALATKVNDAYAEKIVGESTIMPGLLKDGTAYTTFYNAVIGTHNEAVSLEAQLKALQAGGISNDSIVTANKAIADLAKYKATGAKDANGYETNDMSMTKIPGRGDCIALLELDETFYLATSEKSYEEMIINEINKQKITYDNGKYCAVTVPSVYYKMADNEFKNKKFPGAFHYLACFINSLGLGFAEWYASAGYTRGVSSYTIDNTTIKLGEIAINALEPRNRADNSAPAFAVNVIANFRGSYYLWGNRTAHPLGDKNSADNGDLVASHFLNIRHLCTTIKKQLYVACRSFTFDPNSDTLWINFVNAIRPTLDIMKADQGIRDYKILKVYTDKKATLKAKIRIIPIEAVEDFDLEISLEDSFGETSAVVTE